MKKVLATLGSVFNALCCGIFGHYYTVTKKVTSHINEYECIHCKKQVTTDVTGNLSELTPELEDINNTLQKVYRKKHQHAPQRAA
ncbi:hypothetical protein AX016_0646 [Cellulophaga sp. RHA19]|uniref:hypothetical protein n=1 Tax=Cellulophaga sp. RHA19 TaxID=1798237 RepID=UPI000C2C30CA|nr:hypothetical protein [Cellulophaga sp. RHA19]PKB42479.1 hypothetical protein AX016_0646 [Cellulophaga sp. RHA19]